MQKEQIKDSIFEFSEFQYKRDLEAKEEDKKSWFRDYQKEQRDLAPILENIEERFKVQKELDAPGIDNLHVRVFDPEVKDLLKFYITLFPNGFQKQDQEVFVPSRGEDAYAKDVNSKYILTDNKSQLTIVLKSAELSLQIKIPTSVDTELLIGRILGKVKHFVTNVNFQIGKFELMAPHFQDVIQMKFSKSSNPIVT